MSLNVIETGSSDRKGFITTKFRKQGPKDHKADICFGRWQSFSLLLVVVECILGIGLRSGTMTAFRKVYIHRMKAYVYLRRPGNGEMK
jgi:hypothetical protein